METKRIICLANSRKRGEHCVAGIELLDNGQLGDWIRPIGSGWEDALKTVEQAYADNTSPRVLDVLDVHLLGHKPDGCQVENWVVDPSLYWSKQQECDPLSLANAMSAPASLFVNAGSTSAGYNDQIRTDQADRNAGSLLLVRVPQVQIHVISHFGKIKCQARFEYNGTLYWIQVTDPVIEAEFLPGGVKVRDLGECLLTVSLSSPLVKDIDKVSYRFKLIAAIIRLS